MRKAYRKARWLKAFTRAEKRGDKAIICYKKVRSVEIPNDPFTWDGLFENMDIDVSEYRENKGGIF